MAKKMSKKVLQKQLDENEALHQEMLDKCIPIAQEVFKMIYESGMKMGDGDFVKTRPPEYIEASKRIIDMMVEKNISWIDREFIFQLALQPLSHIKSIVMQDLQRTFEHQICSVFGVTSFDELTMKQIQDGLLRIGATKEELKKKVEGLDA